MEAAVCQGLLPSSGGRLSQELRSKQRACHPRGPTAAPGWQASGDPRVLTLHLQCQWPYCTAEPRREWAPFG